MSNTEEPFGWWVDSEKLPFFALNRRKYCGGPSDEWEEMHKNKLTPLYTSPPTRKSLSDAEIDLGYQSSPRNYYDLAFRDGVCFAEKYHKIGIDNV